MEKRKKYHDFYLCDIEPEEGSGYMVKQVNSEGKVSKMHNSVPYKTSVDMYLEKIRDCKYEEGVLEDGYVRAVSYGICFCKKSCIVGKYPGE